MISQKLTNNWDEYLGMFEPSQKDVYFTEEYLKLYEDGEQKATCFVYQEDNKILLFPFLSREFEHRGVILRDFETAYGYGGPIVNADDRQFIEKAIDSFVAYCKNAGFVAGFMRFHPLLKNYEHCRNHFSVLFDRHTVALDLSHDIQEVWETEIHTKNRNVIKKAGKKGLRFVADYQFDHLEEFIKLYDSTMDKLNADSFYYFNSKYYYSLSENIPQSFLGLVFDGDRIVSGAIFLCSPPFGHYHLSGSDKNSLALSPNNFMLWESAKELKKNGCTSLHLGGGTSSDDADSLFCFKRKFSKSLYDFYLGKAIFDPVIYDELCAEWEQKNPDRVEQFRHFLLKYKY